MIELSRILCPVDFSEFSRHALDHAAVLARWYAAEITVVHVCSTPVAVPAVPYGGPVLVEPVALTVERRAELRRELEQFVRPVAASGIPLSLQVVEGSSVDEIVAGAESADLIVMGTHGRSGFERLLLGSVAEKVLRKAPCPVLTVPPKAAGDAPPAFKKILCAVDFSASSRRGLDYALSLAQEADATLTVLHVVEVVPEVGEFELPGFNLREYAVNLESSARERLTAMIPEAARQYCEVREVVGTGKPYLEILRIARETGVDLIVMGVRGRGVADLMLFGSTTQHVVRQASCPVLTLRSEP
jgi:nucleotide-binding universal stress UspA family protein